MIKFSWNIATPICSQIVCDSFQDITAEVNSRDRDRDGGFQSLTLIPLGLHTVSLPVSQNRQNSTSRPPACHPDPSGAPSHAVAHSFFLFLALCSRFSHLNLHAEFLSGLMKTWMIRLHRQTQYFWVGLVNLHIQQVPW